jgi:putative membrane protein
VIHMMHGPWNGAWWDLGTALLGLVFLALVVAGIVLVVRSFSSGKPTEQQPEASRALNILEERFARGELNQEEYEQRRRVLTGGR